jgi:hypothetical protein
MACMFITADVLKLDKSRLVSEEQTENMEPMLVVLEVSTPDRSIFFADLKNKNISDASAFKYTFSDGEYQ